MIRKAKVNDVFDIVKIEKKVFKISLGEKFLLQEIEDNPLSYYMVYEKSKSVVGYIGFRVYDDQAEMMNFAVHPDYQNEGIGRQIIRHALEQLIQDGVKQISLEVRKSNKRAQHIYESMGFELSHIRKQYYEKEDGFVYIKKV